MTLEIGLYLFVLALWLLTVSQGFWLFCGAVRLHRYVRRCVAEAAGLRDASGIWKYRPKAAVILPCCGVDELLAQTVEALGRQEYADYEVIFTFESAEDPAHAAVADWTASWSRPSRKMVVAGAADHRGQKIHNLLAAVAMISPDREVLVFLDSDAIPSRTWLGYLVAPLADRAVGAATGFRWYSAAGGLANGVRCSWNAASLTLITDPKLAFVWGGATAIRRETFESLGVARLWEGALSDDYQVTRAMYEAGLAIRFVPQALIPSHDRATLRAFWTFARRQLIITRVCGPTVFRSALILCTNFIAGGTAVAVLFFAALFGWIGGTTTMWLALAGWMAVLGMACLSASMRQLAVRKVLGPPDVTWRDFAWDVGGVNLSALLHMSLMLSALRSRRFAWRHIVYELVSPNETRIIARLDAPNAAEAPSSTL